MSGGIGETVVNIEVYIIPVGIAGIIAFQDPVDHTRRLVNDFRGAVGAHLITADVAVYQDTDRAVPVQRIIQARLEAMTVVFALIDVSSVKDRIQYVAVKVKKKLIGAAVIVVVAEEIDVLVPGVEIDAGVVLRIDPDIVARIGRSVGAECLIFF